MDKEDSILLLTISLIAFLIGHIPFIGKYIRVFNTLFHEGGHALTAWICGGEVLRIELFGDTSGTTLSQNKNKLSCFCVSISGYVFASFVPFLFIFLLANKLYWLLHALIISFSIILLIKGVRNAFGIIWTLLILAAYILVLVYFPTKAWIMIYGFTGILFFESLYSAGIIAFLSFVKPDSAGDAKNLSTITGIPTQFWGLFFLGQAILFSWLTIKYQLFVN